MAAYCTAAGQGGCNRRSVPGSLRCMDAECSLVPAAFLAGVPRAGRGMVGAKNAVVPVTLDLVCG